MRWALVFLWLSGCHAVFGDYRVDESVFEDGEACRDDDDCDADLNEGCDDGRCAIRCLDDGACPAFSECFAADFCTAPIGTPCDPDGSDVCGGYSCEDRDANATPVDGYCPGYCNPPETPCPTGFMCVQLRCFKTPP